MRDALYEKTVLGHATALSRARKIRDALARRLDVRDDRGDITPRTVGIAAMTAIAVTVTGLIVAKITQKEESIDLGP